jgi:hypothetical protein
MVMPAYVGSFVEKFEQPGGSGSEGRRMGKERGRGGLIGEVLMTIHSRNEEGSNSGDVFRFQGEGEKFVGRGKKTDQWVPCVGEIKREKGTGSGVGRVGRGPEVWLG